MRNYDFIKKSFDTENESTKMILALFAGIAAGAILTSLLVSKNKYNLVDRIMSSGKTQRSQAAKPSVISKNDPAIPHPEEYGGGMMDVIIQAT